jgi:DNA ligase-1
MNIKVLSEIENVGSTLIKRKFVQQLADDDLSLRFVRLVYDPNVTFGVTADCEHLEKLWAVGAQREVNPINFWSAVLEMCLQFADRRITGNAAIEKLEATLLFAPDLEHLKWACRVINKDLRIGVNLGIIQKELPGLIETFSCSLAKPYDPEKHVITEKWIIEPKLDGLRLVVVNGVPFTRNGKKLLSVDHIVKQLPFGGSGWVFDGECMGSGIEFDEISGNARAHESCEDLVYCVFDVIDYDQWLDKDTQPLCQRKADLALLLKNERPNVEVVPWDFVGEDLSFAFLSTIRDGYIDMGFEGAMLKDSNVSYQFKRSDSLLKLKTFKELDGVISGVQEGRGKHRGRLGALLVDHQGVTTKVGSGFSDSFRETLWNKKESIIGKMVEVQYQNMTPDGRLRFPVFVRMRPDKD